MTRRKRYRISFLSQGKVYELYVRSISQGEIFGFVQFEGPLFGEKTQVVVDPSEEELKKEFFGVERCLVPMHAVLRIDEVSGEGVSRVTTAEKGSAVTPFPAPVYGRPPEKP